MPELQQLYQELVEMPQRQYSDLIRQVDAERRRAFASKENGDASRPGMSSDEFAQWIGRRHLAIDKGISRILYLPKGAPPKEVRLLEVNELANIPENAPIEAVDFMPNIAGVDFSLFVADVTPKQFEAITKGQLSLPPGWVLDGAQVLVAEER